jgi:flagellar assembly protein FliH
MNSSPEPRHVDPMPSSSLTSGAPTARFDVDLRAAAPTAGDQELANAAYVSARASGYAEGWAQGQRAAQIAALAALDQAAAAERAHHAARETALEQAVAALARAADQLEQRVAPTAVELEDRLIAVAVDVAQALLGRELADPGRRATDALRRVMSLAPTGVEIKVRLHPDDWETLVEAASAEQVIDGRAVTLCADRSLPPGDAVAEYGTTTIDARLSDALDRVRELVEQ